MESKRKQAGKPVDVSRVPTATESERGIASIAVNHPDHFVTISAEKRFNVADVFDLMSRYMLEAVLTQASRSASCDIRIIYEKVRERLPETEFHQVSEIYTLLPIAGALGDFIEIVRATAKRRAFMGVLAQANIDIANSEVPTAKLLADVVMQTDALSHDLAPPSPMDTKALMMDALKRYESGDDSTQRISTGFAKIDNLTPIRFGDYLIIGGETKSGKTMLALNIIANLLK